MLETMPLENVNLRSVEKDLARQRKRVEEAEAILEDDRKSRLAAEEARLRENSSKRRRIMEEERRLPEDGRRSTRIPEDDEVSSIYGNDLSGPFMRIGKVLYRINDPAVRDNPEYIRRNIIHLEKINEEEISRGLEKSLEARDQIIQTAITEAVGKLYGHYKAEVLNIVDENLGDRMRRIEENEKLSAKVMVEKKDEVRVLDLYVPEPGAPAEVYRKALQHSNGIVKVLERTITFQSDPFNFTLLMCKESNKITADFGLSKTQQWNLIFAHLPPHEVTDFLYLTMDLVNLFKVVSTFATRVVTKQSLEKQINQWKLVNTSETDLNLSLVKLIDLLNKNREGYGTTPAHYPTLFKEAVGIIQRQEGLPMPVLEQLWKARMRVRDTDSVAEITQVLASACQRYIGMRSGKQAKVNQITVGDYENQFQNMMAQVKALTIGTQQQQQQNQNKNKQDQDDEDDQNQDDEYDQEQDDEDDQDQDDEDDQNQDDEYDQDQDDEDDQDQDDEDDQNQDDEYDQDQDEEDDQDQDDEDDQNQDDEYDQNQDDEREGDGEDDQDDDEGDEEATSQDGSGNGTNQGNNDSDSSSSGERPIPMFVKPWPMEKKYLAKRGGFTSEFERHFSNYCHRCGHASHYAARCQIYRDFCAHLCMICRQGCHSICKSRRRDLQRVLHPQQQVQIQIPQLPHGYHWPPFPWLTPTNLYPSPYPVPPADQEKSDSKDSE